MADYRQSATAKQWARDFLVAAGFPVTDNNVTTIIAWMQAEGTAAKNNPLATTREGYGGTILPGNPVGVKEYPTRSAGIKATVDTINNGFYPQIIASLRANAPPQGTALAIANSPWGTHDGVIRVLNSWGITGNQSGIAGIIKDILGGPGIDPSKPGGIPSGPGTIIDPDNPIDKAVFQPLFDWITGWLGRMLMIVAGGLAVLAGSAMLVKATT